MAKSNGPQSPLEIAEVLEMVVSYLPADDIVRCQRTSRFWKTVIDGSSKLQTSQFLKPVKTFETIHWVKRPTGYEPFILPIIRVLSDKHEMWTEKSLEYPIVEFHPLLLKAMTRTSPDYKTATDINIDIESLHAMKPGPWLDMLISQPPVRVLIVCDVDIGTPSKSIKGGITFRNLLGKTIRRKEKYSGKVSKIGYKKLWQERNELRVIEDEAAAFRKRIDVSNGGGKASFSQHKAETPFYQPGWTWSTRIRKLNFLDVVGEHSPWVQQARRSAKNELQATKVARNAWPVESYGTDGSDESEDSDEMAESEEMEE